MKTLSPASPQELALVLDAESSNRRPWLRVFFVLLLMGGGIAGWIWWTQKAHAQGDASQYETEPLDRGEIKLTVTATGNLEPTTKVTVGSEMSGIVSEVNVEVNDHVTKGQQLARLDTKKLTQQIASSTASVTSAQARVSQARATLKESEATLKRLQELHTLSGGKVPSRAEMDTAVAGNGRAVADLGAADASVGEAEAQKRIFENDFEKAVIRSPIDGIVLKRNVEPGQTVAASFTAPELFIIAEKLEHMKLKIGVAEADIGRVAKDQKATFTVDAWPDRTYVAKVVRVSFGALVTTNVVTYETELYVDNSDLSLRPGMTATADIHVAESSDVLLVSTAALRFDPEAKPGDDPQKRSFVQNLVPTGRRWGRGGRNREEEKVTLLPESDGPSKIYILRDGRPEPLTVKLGLSDGRHTEISGEGVEEGMDVIVRFNSPRS